MSLKSSIAFYMKDFSDINPFIKRIGEAKVINLVKGDAVDIRYENSVYQVVITTDDPYRMVMSLKDRGFLQP